MRGSRIARPQPRHADARHQRGVLEAVSFADRLRFSQDTNGPRGVALRQADATEDLKCDKDSHRNSQCTPVPERLICERLCFGQVEGAVACHRDLPEESRSQPAIVQPPGEANRSMQSLQRTRAIPTISGEV